jgi:hypothetical protein
MAKTKAELTSDAERYHEWAEKARLSLAAGRIDEAIAHAVASWDFVDGMMQFERRWADKEFDEIETISLVLEHAPVMLHSESLTKLAQLLKAQKRIDKNASDDIAGRLAQAAAVMQTAHRTWSLIEATDSHRPSDKTEKAILARWEDLGFVRRCESGWRAVTQSTSRTQAKCPSCGAIVSGPRLKLLHELDCPKCHRTVEFTLLTDMT